MNFILHLLTNIGGGGVVHAETILANLLVLVKAAVSIASRTVIREVVLGLMLACVTRRKLKDINKFISRKGRRTCSLFGQSCTVAGRRKSCHLSSVKDLFQEEFHPIVEW